MTGRAEKAHRKGHTIFPSLPCALDALQQRQSAGVPGPFPDTNYHGAFHSNHTRPNPSRFFKGLGARVKELPEKAGIPRILSAILAKAGRTPSGRTSSAEFSDGRRLLFLTIRAEKPFPISGVLIHQMPCQPPQVK